MKKILLIIVLSALIFSCGKKNDPIYKESVSNLLKLKSDIRHEL